MDLENSNYQNQAGVIFNNLGQYEKTIAYYKKAREILEKSGLDHLVAIAKDKLVEVRRKKDEQ